MTIREIILKRFRTHWRDGFSGFVNSQQIQDSIHTLTGKKHETIGRELRRMSEDNLITKKEIKNPNSKISSVFYSYIPTRHEILSEKMKTNG